MFDDVIGEIEFVIRDAQTNEVKQSWIEHNSIQEYGMSFNNHLTVQFGSVLLSQTEIPSHSIRSANRVQNLISQSRIIQNTSSYFENQTRTRLITCRYNPPSSTRTIRSVFLVTPTSNYIYETIACTNLKSPCVQTNLDILDVTYKLVTRLSNTSGLMLVNDHNINVMLNKNTNLFNTAKVFLRPTTLKEPYSGDKAFSNGDFNIGISPFIQYSDISMQSVMATPDTVLGKRSYERRLRYDIDRYPGLIAKYFILQHNTSSTYNYLLYGFTSGEGTTQQKSYKHKRRSDEPLTIPLVENNKFQCQGTVEVNTTDFNEEIPDFYEIIFETPGDVGIATYKLRRRKTFGFFNNTPTNYVETSSSQETVTSTTPTYTETVLDSINGFNDVVLSPSKQFVVGRLQTGLGVVRYNVYDYGRRSWSQTSTPAINTGNTFGYIVADNDDIWIGSTTTGITRIYNNGNSVNVFTQADGLPSLNVLTITKGFNGKIWAIVADPVLPKKHLCYTSDNGHTWVVLNDSTTPQFISPPSDPSQYKIFANQYNDTVWILSSSSTENSIWFDPTTGSSIGPVMPLGNIISSSAIGIGGGTNKWYVSANGILAGVHTTVFGSSTLNQVQAQGVIFLSESVNYNGKTFVYGLAGTTLYSFDELENVQTVDSHNIQLSNYGIPYLDPDNGIVIVYASDGQLKLSCVASSTDIFDPALEGIWKTYGWNASTSQWEVGAPARLTHSTYEMIPGGTQIKFSSGPEPQNSFLTSETFTFVGHKGITIDGTEPTQVKVGLQSLKTETITTFNDNVVSLKPSSIPTTPVSATWVGSGNVSISGDNVATMLPVSQAAGETFTSAAYSLETLEGDFDVEFTFPASLTLGTNLFFGIIPANLVDQGRVLSTAGSVIIESWGTAGFIRDYVDYYNTGNISSSIPTGRISSFVLENSSVPKPFSFMTISRRGRDLYLTIPHFWRLQPQDYYNIHEVYYRSPSKDYTFTYKYPHNVTADDFSYKIVASPFDRSMAWGSTYYGLPPTIKYSQPGIYYTRVGRQIDGTGSFNEFFAGVSFVGSVIQLNGISAKVYNYEDKTTPGPGEVVITRDGYLLFNPSDVGKMIEGEVTVLYNPQKPVV